MKNKIILIVIILTTVLITMIFCIMNKKEGVQPLQSKTEIIKNLKIENENILKSDEAVIIKANIKNNNKETVTIKQLHITLIDENGTDIISETIKLNKTIMANKKESFSIKIKVTNSFRIFAKYKFEID
ncbi:MAG: hypothetical protein ACLTAK_07005 [Bacilli bacterium]|jgi:hypothetical protein